MTNASDLILRIDSHKIFLAYMEFILLDHTLHSKFHDRIAEWLENSYLRKSPLNGKALFLVYTSKDFSGKHDASNFLLLTYHFLLLI